MCTRIIMQFAFREKIAKRDCKKRQKSGTEMSRLPVLSSGLPVASNLTKKKIYAIIARKSEKHVWFIVGKDE